MKDLLAIERLLLAESTPAYLHSKVLLEISSCPLLKKRGSREEGAFDGETFPLEGISLLLMPSSLEKKKNPQSKVEGFTAPHYQPYRQLIASFIPPVSLLPVFTLTHSSLITRCLKGVNCSKRNAKPVDMGARIANNM
jgi:hypothetical protein